MSNSTFLKSIELIASNLVEQDSIQEACLLARFLENKDRATIKMLSRKFKRIFSDKDIKDMSKVVRGVTNKYVPASIRDSAKHTREFMGLDDRNIIKFPKRG